MRADEIVRIASAAGPPRPPAHLLGYFLVHLAAEHGVFRQWDWPEVGEEELGAQPGTQVLQAAHCSSMMDSTGNTTFRVTSSGSN